LHYCRVDGGSSRTSVSIHGPGDVLTALRRQGLIPDEPVLQLATFLRSHDLFLELRVRTPRTLTANQARQGGKQGTDGRWRSRIHFRCLALTSLLRSPPAQRLTISLTSRSFWSGRRCSGLRGRQCGLRFALTDPLENVHPLQGGLLRLKHPSERRPYLPRAPGAICLRSSSHWNRP
jgi:hypothetical protein